MFSFPIQEHMDIYKIITALISIVQEIIVSVV